ncbi:hypothetical protein FB45DRAFT_978948 [Roridomyces roridus]|uniref:Uncharacterized protein n=1 Tax=Roridomyces roridus TaxID=1738132 RepID=A0AAD7FPG1_9AGAR|nr:hypothetical protein FB45DRAFT_978948 [Roridomyces roridus]
MAACVPEISVSLAPELFVVEEPSSPFAWSTVAVDDDDGFRPIHLTPPPTTTPTRFMKQLSPLRPADSPVSGHGLARERFEALLQASRERNLAVGAKKGNDLRKEIALKAHGKKQVERRALFLSKVLAPPSPTATLLPKTPPDSPAIFNYSLPSPDVLVSPLAFFESLNENPACGPLSYGREPWVEQVDFRVKTAVKSGNNRVPRPKSTTHASTAKPVPSLDQISARLSSHGHVRTPSAEAAEQRKLRLPAFLAASRKPAPRLTIGVGRLQMPVRAPVPTKAENLPLMPPRSPCYPLSPNLQVTTLVVPRTASSSPTELSESNLQALNSRERRAKDMLSALRKRTTTPSEIAQVTGHADDLVDRKWKRRSAPAELSPRARSGFEHPVLALPGGF